MAMAENGIELAELYVPIIPETSKLAPGVKQAARRAARELKQEMKSAMGDISNMSGKFMSGWAAHGVRSAMAVDKAYENYLKIGQQVNEAEAHHERLLRRKKTTAGQIIESQTRLAGLYRQQGHALQGASVALAEYNRRQQDYHLQAWLGAEKVYQKQVKSWLKAEKAHKKFTNNLMSNDIKSWLNAEKGYNTDANNRVKAWLKAEKQYKKHRNRLMDMDTQSWLNAEKAWQSQVKGWLNAERAHNASKEREYNNSVRWLQAEYRWKQGQLKQQAGAAKAAAAEEERTRLAGMSRWRRSLYMMANDSRGSAEAFRRSWGTAIDEVGARGHQTLTGMMRGTLTGMGAPLGIRASATGVGVLGAYGTTRFLDTLVQGGFQRLTTIQNSTVAMKALLGNAAQADKLVSDLVAKAQGTPFSADQFLDTARSMVAMGVDVDQVIPSVEALGNALAASGRSGEYLNNLGIIYGKIKSQGRIQGDELLQLAELNIPAQRILANQLGMTPADAAKWVKEGKASADIVIPALNKGIMEGTEGAAGKTIAYAGLMDKMRETVTGSWGVFKAQMNRVGASMIGPAFNQLPNVLNSVSDKFREMANPGGPVERWSEAFSRTGAFEGAVNLFKKIPDALMGGLNGVTTLIEKIESPGAQKVLGTIKGSLTDIWGVVKLLWPDLMKIGGAIVTGFGGAAIGALRATADVLNVISPLLKAITGAGAALSPVLTGLAATWALFALRAKVTNAAIGVAGRTMGLFSKQVMDTKTGVVQQVSLWGQMRQGYADAKTKVTALSAAQRTLHDSRQFNALGQQVGFWSQLSRAYQTAQTHASGLVRTKAALSGAMTGLKAVGSGLMGAMGGPWGIAITGLGVGLGYLATKHAEAKRAAEEQKRAEDDLRASIQATLDAESGRITEETRTKVASELIDTDAFKAVKQAGIDPKLLTDAVLNQDEGAFLKLKEEMEKGRWRFQDGEIQKVIETIGKYWKSVREAADKQKDLNEALNGTLVPTQAATDKFGSLGATIKDIPSAKRVVLEVDPAKRAEAFATLETWGYKIQEIPGSKEFIAIADTEGAMTDFRNMITQMDSLPDPVVTPQIEPNPALSAFDELLKKLNNGRVDLPVGIQPGADIPGMLLPPSAVTPGQAPTPLLPGPPVPLPRVPGSAKGSRINNLIRGPGTGTSDEVAGVVDWEHPILVSNGESIVTERGTRHNWPWINAINKGLNLPPFPGFRGGGFMTGQVRWPREEIRKQDPRAGGMPNLMPGRNPNQIGLPDWSTPGQGWGAPPPDWWLKPINPDDYLLPEWWPPGHDYWKHPYDRNRIKPYAKGGVLGNIKRGGGVSDEEWDVWGWVDNNYGTLSGAALFGQDPMNNRNGGLMRFRQGGPFAKAGKKGKIKKFAGGGLVYAYQVAQSAAGQDYDWGGHSFSGADCSGYVSMVVNAATGRDPVAGRMNTGSAGAYMQALGGILGPGPAGTLRVGWVNGGPGGGHMAGTMPDGTNFESGGAHGTVMYGGSAKGAADFPNQAYLPWDALYPDGTVTMAPGAPKDASYSSGGQIGGVSGGANAAGAFSGNADLRGGGGAGGYNAKQAAADKKVREAEQKVADKQAALDIANQKLEELNAKDPSKVKDSQRMKAENDVTKATREHEDALADLDTAQQDYQTKLANGDFSPNGQNGGQGNEQFKTVGQAIFGGILESIGLDGSVFSNPFEWPNVKSLMAGINWGGGLLKALMGPRKQGQNGMPGADDGMPSGILGGGDGGGILGGLLGGMTEGMGVQSFLPSPYEMGPNGLQPAPGDFNPVNDVGSQGGLSLSAPNVMTSLPDQNGNPMTNQHGQGRGTPGPGNQLSITNDYSGAQFGENYQQISARSDRNTNMAVNKYQNTPLVRT